MMEFMYPQSRSVRSSVMSQFFDDYMVGTNLKGDFSPVYSIYDRQEILGTNRGYMYFKPKNIIPTSGLSLSTNYDELVRTLEIASQLGLYRFTVDNENHTLYTHKGFLMDIARGNILMMLAIDDYTYRDKDNPDRYKLFVAKEFMNDPRYKNVWKQIEKRYVADVHEHGIDVEYTSSEKIDQKFYNGCPEISYSTVDELEGIKKKYHEYFNWIAITDVGRYYIGCDYVPPKFFRQGYDMLNIKCTKPRFQAMLWLFVDKGVYYVNEAETMSLDDFIRMVEESNQPGGVRFICEKYEFTYDPENHDIIDLTNGERFHLMLSKKNMFTEFYEDIPKTLWKIQNYVNFAHAPSLGSLVRECIDEEFMDEYVTVENGTRMYHIPSHMRIDKDTPAYAIG